MLTFSLTSARRSRSLLNQEIDSSCHGSSDRIINCTTQSVTGVITIQNITVCKSGQNEIFYDIGALDVNGFFKHSVLGAFTLDMVVVTGPAAVFLLKLQNSSLQRTYSPISSALSIVLQDQGRNVNFLTIFVLKIFEIVIFFEGC
jgi:hypothetical protein